MHHDAALAETPTDEIFALAEVLGDIKTRFERVESELSTQAKPLESAVLALNAALAGLKALQFHVLDNNLGALSVRVEEQRKAIDEQIGVVVAELKKADEENTKTAAQVEAKVRGELSGVLEQIGSLTSQFSREIGRVQLEAKREVESLAMIPGPKGEAGRSVNPTGSYDAARAYQRLDIVSLLGGSYISSEDDNREKPGTKAKKWTQLVARPSSLGGNSVSAQTQLVSAPATATSSGTPGQFAYSGGYLYVCTASNVWRRTALTTF